MDALTLTRVTDRLGDAVAGLPPGDPGAQAFGRVLCVDDEPLVLDGLSRSLRGHYDVHTATGGNEGLAYMRDHGPFAVVVSDMRMPGMDGAAFLSEVRRVAPDTVRMLLTGFADIDAAIAVVNEGQLFRFLSKPCPRDVLLQALEGADAQFRLVRAERDILAKTLKTSVATLIQVLNMTDPQTFYESTTLSNYAAHMATELGVDDPWRFRLAAMLSHIGAITMSPETLARMRAGQDVSEEDHYLQITHPEIGRRLVERVPGLEVISRMIGLQSGPGTERDEDPAADLGGAMLRLGLEVSRLTSQGLSIRTAVGRLAESGEHPVELIETMSDYRSGVARETVRAVSPGDLELGMVLDEDLRAPDGSVLLTTNSLIDASSLECVETEGHALRDTIRVRVELVD